MNFPVTKEGRTLYYAVMAAIPPRTQSDRTSFRRMVAWLEDQVVKRRLQPDVFEVCKLIANESCTLGAKNPAAVFTAAFQKEFGYGHKPDGQQSSTPGDSPDS